MGFALSVVRLLLAVALVAGALASAGIALFLFAWIAGDPTPQDETCVGGHTAYGVAMLSVTGLAVLGAGVSLVQALRWRPSWWPLLLSAALLVAFVVLFLAMPSAPDVC
jgi:phage shock protein PspC (stress-responsive transcriptional regulator)